MLKSLALLLTTSAATFATVVSDTNVTLRVPGYFYQYALRIYQDAAATDYTEIEFDRSGQNLTLRMENADEGSDWYFAALNNPFTAATISQGSFTPFSPAQPTHNVGFTDFYFGINTGRGFAGGTPGREVFGWALLRNSASGLQLLGSAVTYDRPGIVIGTTTTVPEPTAALLLAGAAFPLLLRRRRG